MISSDKIKLLHLINNFLETADDEIKHSVKQINISNKFISVFCNTTDKSEISQLMPKIASGISYDGNVDDITEFHTDEFCTYQTQVTIDDEQKIVILTMSNKSNDEFVLLISESN